MDFKEKQEKIKSIVEKQQPFLTFTPTDFEVFITVAENKYGFSGINGVDVKGQPITPVNFRHISLNQKDGMKVKVYKPEIKELFGKPAVAVTYTTSWNDKGAYAGKKEYINKVFFDENGIYGGVIPNVKDTPKKCKFSNPNCETLWKDFQNYKKDGWEYVGDLDFTRIDKVKERKLMHGVLFNLANKNINTDTKTPTPELIK